MKREILLLISIFFILSSSSCGHEPNSDERVLGKDPVATQQIIVPITDSSDIRSSAVLTGDSAVQDTQQKTVNHRAVEANRKKVFLDLVPGREFAKPPQNPQWADSVYQENLRKKHIRDSIRNVAQ